MGIGRSGIGERGPLTGAGAEECCVISALAMDQRDETLFAELLLLTIGDRDLGRALQRRVAFHVQDFRQLDRRRRPLEHFRQDRAALEVMLLGPWVRAVLPAPLDLLLAGAP